MSNEVSQEGTGEFMTAEALELVSAYFDSEWPQTDLSDVQLTKVTGGFVNRLHVLTRSTPVKNEPQSVLIRHFGQNGKTFNEEPLASTTTLSATEQALIYHEMGRRGWGPKIYGVFKGGRLEEYVDAHPLTAAEASDESIRRDLARGYARLHSLQLPFRKNNFKLAVQEFKDICRRRRSQVVESLTSLRYPAALELAAHVRDMDWETELEWLSVLFKKHQCRPTIAQGDCNFLNVLIKDHRSECRAIPIDYETCTYSYRGIDIGGHFNERMYCWSNEETNLTGYPAPGLDEQRSFCRSYLQEMRDLNLEMTENDTEEHLLLEAQIGRMWQLLFSVLMGFTGNGLPDVPVLFVGLSHMLATYNELKSDWLRSE